MSRMSGRKAKQAREFCIKRDGPGCHMADRSCLGDIVLHHCDHNPDNNPADGSNWMLLCLSHNGRMDPRGRQANPKFSSFKRLKLSKERVRVQTEIGIRGISAEMAHSQNIRPIIEEYIEKELATEERVSLIEMMYACAYVAKCDPGIAKKHITVLSSAKEAPFCMDPQQEYIYLRKSRRQP